MHVLVCLGHAHGEGLLANVASPGCDDLDSRTVGKHKLSLEKLEQTQRLNVTFDYFVNVNLVIIRM